MGKGRHWADIETGYDIDGEGECSGNDRWGRFGWWWKNWLQWVPGSAARKNKNVLQHLISDRSIIRK